MDITESDNMYHIDQNLYMSKSEQIPSNTEFNTFSPMRMKLAWQENNRLHIVLEISRPAQGTWAMYE